MSLDISGGEQDNNLALWARRIDEDSVDIYQPDICYMGGIERTMRVVEWRKKPVKLLPRTQPICHE
ncbi:MAG: hypothetical protein MJK13_19270 [Pseudomonadales bacterium]|nr:hypothetical protein [Pseudomonadales bacterium]